MRLGDWTRPRARTARYGAQIGGSILKPRPGEKDQLTIDIWRYPKLDWDQKIISMSQVKLKATIAHELEHYLDPSLLDASYNRLNNGVTKPTTLTEHFAYKNQSTEIRAVPAPSSCSPKVTAIQLNMNWITVSQESEELFVPTGERILKSVRES
jgi:hypothetical protein